jgi:predicted SAM-dependent methyltransferase
MPIRKEVQALYDLTLKGKGLNIGCGDVMIGTSIGVDLSKSTAKACRIEADACDLPWEDNKLDYIISCASFEHIDRGPIMVLREWLRVLKVGGRIGIVVPDAEYGIWAMTGDTGRCGELCKEDRAMEHLHAFTATSLRLLFEFAGMVVERIERIHRKPVRPEQTILCVGRKLETFKC